MQFRNSEIREDLIGSPILPMRTCTMGIKTKKGPNALLLIMQDVDEAYEPELNASLDEEHLPQQLKMPGFKSVRRFVRVDGNGPKYMHFWEMESLDALKSEEFLRASANPTARSREKFKHQDKATYKRVIYVELHE